LSDLTADRIADRLCGCAGDRLGRAKRGSCDVGRSGRTADHRANPGAHHIANHCPDRTGRITDRVTNIAADRLPEIVDRATCRTPCGVADARGTILDDIADRTENRTGIAANGVTDGAEGVARGAGYSGGTAGRSPSHVAGEMSDRVGRRALAGRVADKQRHDLALHWVNLTRAILLGAIV
jgi:hypothetical protein